MGLTTPLVSQVLAYYEPMNEPIYRDTLTIDVLKALNIRLHKNIRNDPALKVHRKYVYSRESLKELHGRLIKLMPNTCFILLDILLKKIGDELGIKEGADRQGVQRERDDTCISRILNDLNVTEVHRH